MSLVATESAISFHGWPTWLLMCSSLVRGACLRSAAAATTTILFARPGWSSAGAAPMEIDSACLESVAQLHACVVQCLRAYASATSHAMDSATLLVIAPTPSTPASVLSNFPPAHPMHAKVDFPTWPTTTMLHAPTPSLAPPSVNKWISWHC
eukprot:7886111-Alexandrium_andersonii.AAC.1